MDKKQVTDLRSELLDSRFGAKSISTIAESKRFPLHEMRDDVAFQIINDELYLDGNARQNLATFIFKAVKHRQIMVEQVMFPFRLGIGVIFQIAIFLAVNVI